MSKQKATFYWYLKNTHKFVFILFRISFITPLTSGNMHTPDSAQLKMLQEELSYFAGLSDPHEGG